ncbi:DNA methyltransferase [Rhizobium laguerreae]
MDFEAAAKPVSCLGKTFENENARREHFRGLLREHLSDPQFRATPGFPQGSDDAIVELSDPPYYTACPNPFMAQLIEDAAPDDASHYYRTPLAVDVAEGKNDPIYNLHSYHTKVPPRAIMRYILHYTKPGDLVLDSFCGTGMTGVASQLCGDAAVVKELGLKVDAQGNVFQHGSTDPCSEVGARVPVLLDLSPAATFITNAYNTPQTEAHWQTVESHVSVIDGDLGWLYQTLHAANAVTAQKAATFLRDKGEVSDDFAYGRVNYIVWSDIYSCPQCAESFDFWTVAVDQDEGKVRDEFPCPRCQKHLGKGDLEPVKTWTAAPDGGEPVARKAQRPVLVNYTYGKKRFTKEADVFDEELSSHVSRFPLSDWVPTDPISPGDKSVEAIRAGYKTVDSFYTARSLQVLARLRKLGLHSWPPFSALTPRATRMHRIAASRIGGEKKGVGGATVGVINGTLYIPSLSVEMNVLDQAKDRVKNFSRSLHAKRHGFISTQSGTHLTSIPNSSIDYIFIDPPFGANLIYSDLNQLWEGWLAVHTANEHEAIESAHQEKTINSYRRLMSSAFAEAFRVLKPGRWITIEFSNTRASVWNAIQVALQEAGFVVANVSALDKKQGSFNAVTNPTSVKQDLVISAYKPNGGLEERFERRSSDVQSVWDFVSTHLKNLPVLRTRGDQIITVPERDPRIIFDRMIAWFVSHGVPIPLSSGDFQAELRERFPSRDGMIFLPQQIDTYDRAALQKGGASQIELFVSDEKSAIDWLGDHLRARPSSRQEITNDFTQKIGAGWRKHEAKPELIDLLEQNFLMYDGNGPVPTQVHSYLSSNWKDLRNLDKDDPRLVERARNRWFVPDPNKQQDVEARREKALLREFDIYKAFKGKKMKEIRLEVMRVGFKAAWAAKDYRTIIDVSAKVPDEVWQEDERLMMLHSMAETRLEADR